MQFIDSTATDFDDVHRRFRWSIPEYLNIAQQVCERHQQDSARPAIYYENDNGETAAYDFSALKKLSDQLASVLQAHGVEPGQRVGGYRRSR
jgi:acetyl-CoA synthetase